MMFSVFTNRSGDPVVCRFQTDNFLPGPDRPAGPGDHCRRLSVDEVLKGPIKERNCPENLYNVSATKNTPGIAGGISTAELLFRELTGHTVLQ